ncbi:MAG TPA: hypothetical protein VNA19_09505 [Pyrinomonadaceae bacterium]|jgi:hypothetical protein|nr:hypothetical protein [Pyrinomonadaceae bacterium]
MPFERTEGFIHGPLFAAYRARAAGRTPILLHFDKLFLSRRDKHQAINRDEQTDARMGFFR